MNVTEVRISPAKGGKIRAFASIIIDDCFIVNDLRVMEGREGQLYVTMPARKVRNGQLRDIAHPLNTETRQLVEEKVIEEYERSVEQLAVPDPETARRKETVTPLDRLAAKLFVDDFWLVDATPGGDASNEVNE